MKQLKNLMVCSVAFLAMTISGCNNGGGNNEPQRDENEVSVFFLSGQSNMEGKTNASGLESVFTELGYTDYADVAAGLKEVQCSIYVHGYGGLDHNNLINNSQVYATNTENQIAGKFVDLKPGLGTNANSMGPELGCGYALREKATEEKPIFLIKMACDGSGFEQSGTQYNWPVKDANGNFPEINLYNTFAKPFFENNLRIIEDMGLKPVVKGWLWHQGESDTAQSKIDKYAQRLGDMVAQMREDFAGYARDEDGSNIAFIDGMIYQGEGTQWGAQTSVNMNNVKRQFADSADNNYLVDIYANEEAVPENELKPGQPGGDSYHYNVKSCLRLGMAYGKVILDNNLLD